MGFLPPVVHIRDNLELKPTEYRILLYGVEVGRGVAMNGQLLAIDPGEVTTPLQGTPTTDPAFGLPAVWIVPALREQAQISGYTVVDAATVRSEEHTSELQSLMRISYAVFCLKKKQKQTQNTIQRQYCKYVNFLYKNI